MTKKTILGQGAWYLVYGAGERTYIATTFTFDDANQLVSSTTDGVTTFYAYDAAGRLVTEGNKTYRYGYLDKVLSVTDGDTTRTFTYHADGQLATANNERADANRSTVGRGDPTAPQSETFLWDGLALIRRNDEHFINEPHVGGGNPVASSKGKSYFNDILGTTVGFKTNGKYSPAALSAFGERLDNADGTFPAIRSLGEGWFTGKPYVEGLGHAFLMRNYRASLGKWQTADPLGYPDGWNQLAYCNNGVTSSVDLWGCLGIVESEIQAAINKLVDGYVNASTIAGLLAGNSPTDCDDLEISGSIDVDIKSIEVVYSKEILGIQGSDCTTTWKRDPVNIPVGQKRERNLPRVYPVRNVVGDRAIGHFEGQISSFALSGMNLTVEDDGLIVDVHIKSIKIEGSFSFKVDLTYRNFIKE